MLHNFSFLVEGEIAGSARPGIDGPLKDDIEFLRSEGIDAIVSLTETPLPIDPRMGAGIAHRHIPVPDFQPPSISQMAQFTEFVRDHTDSGGRVLVHCHAGVGRTGTMLAAWLVSKGMSAADAIQRVREARPGSIETASQVRAVRDWEDALRGPAGRD